jgi:hypothetical protein
MTYSTNGSVTESAVGVGATTFYRLNSVYDPDLSGVGTYTTGYTTWSALFKNYKVRAVTVRIKGFISSGTTSGAMVTMAPIADASTIPSNTGTWRALRGGKSDICLPKADGGHNVIEWTKTYDIPKCLSVTKAQYANDLSFSGYVGSNPARVLNLVVAVASFAGTTASTFSYTLDITYEVEWFNVIPMQI